MKNKEAQALGRLGGKVKSAKKLEAVRKNAAIARQKLAERRAAEQALVRLPEQNAQK